MHCAFTVFPFTSHTLMEKAVVLLMGMLHIYSLLPLGNLLHLLCHTHTQIYFAACNSLHTPCLPTFRYTFPHTRSPVPNSVEWSTLCLLPLWKEQGEGRKEEGGVFMQMPACSLTPCIHCTFLFVLLPIGAYHLPYPLLPLPNIYSGNSVPAILHLP